jgi:hypothetical protein
MSLITLATRSIEAKEGKMKKKETAFPDYDTKKEGKNG